MKKPIFALIIAAGALVLPALPAQVRPSDIMIFYNSDGRIIGLLEILEGDESRFPNQCWSIGSIRGDPSMFGHPMFVLEGGE